MNETSYLKDSKALVTGANGFIGSHLVDSLLSSGCEVHCLVRKTSNLRWLQSKEVQLHFVDLGDSNFKIPTLHEINYIFHCAGLTKAKNREEYFDINARVCSTLYEQCLEFNESIKGIVHLSSLAAAGPSEGGVQINEDSPLNPVTYYGKSKRAGEEIAQKYSEVLPIMILRPPVVYGPREENLYTFFKLIKKGWALQIGETPKKLSLIYVADLIRAMIKACGTSSSRENNYFVTDGEIYSWEDIAKNAENKMNVSARVLKMPEGILSPIAIIFELLAMFSSKPALFDRQRMVDIRQSCWTASPERFFRDFDFKPEFDLATGLAYTLDWYEQQKWL
ncbi:MAG: NAD(P)-dependent oxidoreductase [Nitrospinae bacterium]|nr:NAD(P)-dependent oxidoreductase [Nitrospinota bacterium]